MTKTKRVVNVLQGILMVLFAAALIAFPDLGLFFAVFVIGISLFLRGAGALIYYFQMARSMVGGKSLLYQGIIYLDLGLFAASLMNNGAMVIVCYIAVVNVLAGLIDLLRAVELIRERSRRWVFNAALALVSFAVAAAAITLEVLDFHTDLIVYIYAGGLLYAAIQRIAGSFRRTAIVYIP